MLAFSVVTSSCTNREDWAVAPSRAATAVLSYKSTTACACAAASSALLAASFAVDAAAFAVDAACAAEFRAELA